MRNLYLLLLLFFAEEGFSQKQVKEYKAVRTNETFSIDGELKEPAWQSTPAISDLVTFRPAPNVVEREANKSEFYLLYDNNYVYFGGYCHESNVDSISKELVGRDRIGNSDFVGVIFDTYYDRINATGFYITPYGEQLDSKYSNSGNEDESWNSVWESAAKMQSDGWSFEARIPYSALRFSTQENQTWGLNFIRKRQKTSEQYSWSFIDPTVNGFINQEGMWTGIEKIKSPLRLSFSPYFSAYVNHYPHQSNEVKDFSGSINGGMDVKYGINESFTLDMTLIPDFGQVQSDNRVLNLSPFEVQYNENRSFFTEGTELFSKGDIFYSRRIGGTPLHYDDINSRLDSNETIFKNPTESKLINATKISGRTAKGLGVGFLNALTKPMYAIARDATGKERKIQTSSLTNYNILVLDQNLKNNSSISFINTNVLRKGEDYDANVSAAVFNFNNKQNTWNLRGKMALSNLYNFEDKTVSGYNHEVRFGKTGGRLNFSLSQELADKNYNPNDLGILFNNNYLDHFVYIGYHWNKPSSWFNNLHFNNNFSYSRRFSPASYQVFRYNTNLNGRLKNLMNGGINLRYQANGNDFYEPRMAGRVFKRPGSFRVYFWLNSNDAKKYYFEIEGGYTTRKMFGNQSFSVELENNYRFSDKFSVGHSLEFNPNYNEAGYADIRGIDVIFSRRDRNTVINRLSSKYNFNNRAGITFRARHYWSKVNAKQYFNLQDDGSLKQNSNYTGNKDQNYNAFNIDMVYTWQFAPGSFLNIVWKDAVYTFDPTVDDGYGTNLKNVLSAEQNNNLSIKLIYFLDVLKLRRHTF